ncbi:hypothetical protein VB264_02215 [Arcicella aquatica]|uniref:Uncharacterized protein n=1 Tax=Arcicella aquatica TaxID=217141 RepID=A0ABU5QIN6_9BACT|nr:hypothetical protein [Arcicella aquatica]MEA5256579.1 hypothetical protein [Arcicella aquatica]
MKLDFSAIENYGQKYANQVCDDFFNRTATINGQQILKLSNVAQVNMFVVSDLFEKWKADTEAFKSPYFNFDSDDVKAALKTFMNTASQNIMVKREHFEPMLSKAVVKTIILLLDPSKYFDDFVRDSPEFTLTKERLAQLAKYTKINSHIAKSMTEKMGNDDKVYVTVALNWLNEISDNVAFENVDKYFETLSAKVPFKKEDFIKASARLVEEIPVKKAASQSFFDIEDELDDENAPLPTVDKIQAEIDRKGTPAEMKLPGLDRLNDTFVGDLPTVNDLLKRDNVAGGTPLADLAFNRPIKSIADGVSLNQKFVFIGKLFDGDINAYSNAIDKIDACSNLSDAKNYMNKYLAPKYNWISVAEEANDFLEVVARKFH